MSVLRYRLTCDGAIVGYSTNPLMLVNRNWDAIKAKPLSDWIMLDTAPMLDQRCYTWMVSWSDVYNGVELTAVGSS